MNVQARVKALRTPDKLIGGGLVIALVALFLPWYGISLTIGSGSVTSSVNGFNSWGLMYFVVWVATAAFWVIMVFEFRSTRSGTFSLADWQILFGGGALMLLFALIYYRAVPVSASGSGYSYGIQFGWFVALTAGAAVAIGGYLKRNSSLGT